MRILIVTPLYPPDLGALSAYVKNCVKKAKKSQEITVATYGHIPEQLPNVRIICTDKRLPTFVRTLLFTYRLWKASRGQNLLYVSDGASVGVPAVLVSWIRQIPLIRFVMADEARERLEQMTRTQIDQELFMKSPAPTVKIRHIRALQNWVLRQSTKCVFPHQQLKDKFVSYYSLSEHKTAVAIYPPQDLELPPFPLKLMHHQLLCLSPLYAQSTIDRLFEEFVHLRKVHLDTQLILANEYSDEVAVQKKIAELHVQECVQSLGLTSRVERTYLLKTSGALIISDGSLTSTDDVYSAYRAEIPVIYGTSFANQVKELFDEPKKRASFLQEQNQILESDLDWQAHLNSVFSV